MFSLEFINISAIYVAYFYL